MSAARSKGTYLAAQYRRIAARRGPVKAIVAVEHAILIAIWNMLTNSVFYQDLAAEPPAHRSGHRPPHRPATRFATSSPRSSVSCRV